MVFLYLYDVSTSQDSADTRRVVVIYWKNKPDNPFQVFSNLKNFCASYQKYNYNTLNNYLSKGKKPYENDQVRIERKSIITGIITNKEAQSTRRVVRVVKKGKLHELEQDWRDHQYWLSMPVSARAAALTTLVAQSLEPGQRMDKSFVRKGKRIGR